MGWTFGELNECLTGRLWTGAVRQYQGLSGVVITRREKGGGRDRDRAAGFQSTAIPSEEVRRMNAVSMWVLPLAFTAGD